MPVVEVSWVDDLVFPLSVFIFICAEIDYEAVSPVGTLRRDTIFSTKELAHRPPGLHEVQQKLA